jgi:hypothetical protein
VKAVCRAGGIKVCPRSSYARHATQETIRGWNVAVIALSEREAAIRVQIEGIPGCSLQGACAGDVFAVRKLKA